MSLRNRELVNLLVACLLTGIGFTSVYVARQSEISTASLSYAALADYRRCGYRFLAERILQIGREEDLPSDPDDRSRGPGGLGYGRAVHALLEWSARNGWRRPPEEAVAAALGREGLDGAAADRAAGLVAGWLGSA